MSHLTHLGSYKCVLNMYENWKCIYCFACPNSKCFAQGHIYIFFTLGIQTSNLSVTGPMVYPLGYPTTIKNNTLDHVGHNDEMQLTIKLQHVQTSKHFIMKIRQAHLNISFQACITAEG